VAFREVFLYSFLHRNGSFLFSLGLFVSFPRSKGAFSVLNFSLGSKQKGLVIANVVKCAM